MEDQVIPLPSEVLEAGEALIGKIVWLWNDKGHRTTRLLVKGVSVPTSEEMREEDLFGRKPVLKITGLAVWDDLTETNVSVKAFPQEGSGYTIVEESEN